MTANKSSVRAGLAKCGQPPPADVDDELIQSMKPPIGAKLPPELPIFITTTFNSLIFPVTLSRHMGNLERAIFPQIGRFFDEIGKFFKL